VGVGLGALSDVWYAEADTPVGPWLHARRVIAHRDYSFYWPAHHAFFDQEGGRVLHVQGANDFRIEPIIRDATFEEPIRCPGGTSLVGESGSAAIDANRILGAKSHEDAPRLPAEAIGIPGRRWIPRAPGFIRRCQIHPRAPGLYRLRLRAQQVRFQELHPVRGAAALATQAGEGEDERRLGEPPSEEPLQLPCRLVIASVLLGETRLEVTQQVECIGLPQRLADAAEMRRRRDSRARAQSTRTAPSVRSRRAAISGNGSPSTCRRTMTSR